ncbi:hypothetical protein ABPG74_000159 [Tetrahymena malaccensis]
MEEEAQVNCSNCNKPQLASKVQLHEAYCLRNIRKCPDCEEFIDKRELENHKQEKHTKQQCKFCSQSFLPKDMDLHLQNCDMKPQRCTYCNLDVNGAEFAEHIQNCGSRTRECFICNKSIILFNFEEHVNNCVGIQEQPYESQFPSHTQAFQKPKPGQFKPSEIKPYKPQATNVSSSRVQIGGNSSIKKNADDQEKADEEFARKLQLAQENNDFDQIKKLQEEEDERLARELNKDFSPKNKTVQQALNSQNKPKQSYDDYDYNYNYEEEDEEDNYHNFNQENEIEQQEMLQAQQYQQGLNNPLVFPSYQKPEQNKTKEQKEMEELGEFIDDDPELQEAILQSQMNN